MANDKHLELLYNDVPDWNNWRRSNPTIRPDLGGADLEDFDLCGADLFRADLNGASLAGAELRGAILTNAQMIGACLEDADLSGASLNWVDASTAIFSNADLTSADMRGSHFVEAQMVSTTLESACLTWADFEKANLANTNARGADLSMSRLVQTNLENADLSGCRVYGCSVWDVKTQRAVQRDLIITPENVATVTVDDLKVAQFIYLILDNPELRNVIDTITSRAVLILGRFSPKRKAVLDTLRDRLRQKGYVPILFDFTNPTNRTLTETVSILGKMSRFIIADITDPKSIPQELSHMIPFLPSVPVQPLLLKGKRTYGLFEHWTKYPWVLPVYEYESLQEVRSQVVAKVIEPAERRLARNKQKHGVQQASQD